MNIIDFLIIVFLGYFLLIGFYRGFIRQFLDLVTLILAFFLAFKFYGPVGNLLLKFFNLPESFASVIGFFVIWFIVELIYYILIILLYDRIPESTRSSKWNRFTGMIPASLRGLISLWVFLGLILILPLPTVYRDLVKNSLIGSQIVKSSSTVEKYVGNIFGDAISETINFLTIKPESDETIQLGFQTTDVSIDRESEDKMLELVNQERTSRGLRPLKMDRALQDVARAHSRDMFARGYFAHNNPDGETPFDRMDEAKIKYLVAGENLALAPDVNTAHEGLMNSEGHKANILTADFGKVGIGVIDGGRYGKMFSQEFTN